MSHVEDECCTVRRADEDAAGRRVRVRCTEPDLATLAQRQQPDVAVVFGREAAAGVTSHPTPRITPLDLGALGDEPGEPGRRTEPGEPGRRTEPEEPGARG